MVLSTVFLNLYQICNILLRSGNQNYIQYRYNLIIQSFHLQFYLNKMRNKKSFNYSLLGAQEGSQLTINLSLSKHLEQLQSRAGDPSVLLSTDRIQSDLYLHSLHSFSCAELPVKGGVWIEVFLKLGKRLIDCLPTACVSHYKGQQGCF